MRLNTEECWERLAASEHGVLATVHARRGVDAVPVVFVVSDERVLIPIDTVKQKTTTRLQRIVNVEQDPRCVLLVDEYSHDWSKLWWVRLHARAHVTSSALAPLFERYEDYEDPDTIASIIVLEPDVITGWTA